MKKSVKILALLPLVAAMSCGKAEYKLTMTFADDAQDGSTVYLINYDKGDTIDSAVVADKQAVFAGTVDHAIVARVLANQSRATFILESGVLELNWETKEVKGGALNDSVAALNAEQSALQEKAVAMSKQAKEEQWTEDKLEEELSKLDKEFRDILIRHYEANKLNAFGWYAYYQNIVEKAYHLISNSD